MLERLHVEYDALVMRAVGVLHGSPGRVAWQFLAVVPFTHVSSNMLWQMFFYLIQYDCRHVGKLILTLELPSSYTEHTF